MSTNMSAKKLNGISVVLLIIAFAVPLLLPSTQYDRIGNLLFDLFLTLSCAVQVYRVTAFKEYDKTSNKIYMVVNIIILALGVYLTIKNLISIL